ncbi:hypothetical protein [Alkalimarinus coralli]|uniref:hypothetical protein n=1 Tax=Alkalimarinus coralli TaxID=2935863 RepID=UPI00202B6383|nr:hypothetical protein [Alkalimarinus coralli]
MAKQPVGIIVAISVLILVNTMFYLLFYPDMLSVEQSEKTDRWLLVDNQPVSAPDISQLITAGFWGEKATKKGASQTVAGEVQGEAQVLRQRISAIIGGAKGLEVLFEVGKEYQRFKNGDTLPGTKWRLLEVYADRLVLVQEGQNPRQLNIYSEDSLVEIDQGMTESN